VVTQMNHRIDALAHAIHEHLVAQVAELDSHREAGAEALIGRAHAMAAIEQQARVLGAVAVELHVFGENLPARGLYEKCGYRYTSMHMSKDLH